MREFKINKFITVRLEDQEIENLEITEKITVIYIGNKPFIQCKHLLLDIPLTEIENIKSVEEAVGFNLRANEYLDSKLSADVIFQCHCSNLQAWEENNYDTRILHVNIAFPLLKRLTELGDSAAKRVFKEEIAKRLERGIIPVIEYLLEEGYLEYLDNAEISVPLTNLFKKNIRKKKTEIINYLIERELHMFLKREEFLSIFLNENDAQVILEIEAILDEQVFIGEYLLEGKRIWFTSELVEKPKDEFTECSIQVEDMEVTSLNLSYCDISEFPHAISQLKCLRNLILNGNHFKKIPKSVQNLKDLKSLHLADCGISILPDGIDNLKNLNWLNLLGNNISEKEKMKILKKKGIQVFYNKSR